MLFAAVSKWVNFQVHAANPEPRIVQRVAKCLLQGGVVVYPTDSTYAPGCHIGNKSALDRIRQIRRLDTKHHFTLVCRDLSELSIYSQVHNSAYKILKGVYARGPTRLSSKRLQKCLGG